MSETTQLESGTYEILKNRLDTAGRELQERLNQLNQSRKEVFGAVATKLLATERVTTEHNCTPVDMVPVGDCFLFGYNVRFGLKTETALSDVFSIYRYHDHVFAPVALDIISDERFLTDFRNLYQYYRETQFAKFAIIGPNLYMVFRVGKKVEDIKVFKWAITPEGIRYIDNRSDHEFKFPQQHEFQWRRVTREMHRKGKHPHISIEDRVFVETIGGDLTIKVEDNTETGQGIYSEEVEQKDQTLDDADIAYAIIDNIIVLRIKPFKEAQFRYIIYNDKIRKAVRVDALEDACVLLPDDQGIIFANGYFLQTGDYKLFDSPIAGMKFEKRQASPNGEDFLFVFFERTAGLYVLLFYNLIEQRVENLLRCHGYSIFDNGELLFFRSEEEPQRHHTIYIWQTPFLGPNVPMPAIKDSYLSRIGNKDLVLAMAECRELLTLLHKDESYLNRYVDLTRRATDITDSYHWLDKEEAYALIQPLTRIREASSSAIDEYEKVTRIRKNTENELARVGALLEDLIKRIRFSKPDHINGFVQLLSESRQLRGEIISLRELRYVNAEKVNAFEKELDEYTGRLSRDTVDFLLRAEALQPYEKRVKEVASETEKISKVTEADALDAELLKLATELEMLIEIVSNLKIQDATETTRIIDNISTIYAGFNGLKAQLRNRRKELAAVEGRAQFNAQLKLIDQSVVNYLDVCDKPDKCELYLNKLIIGLEELESRFAEFDDFMELIAEKREEIYNAFESKKVSLVEAQNKRAQTLQASAERILKGVSSKALSLETVADINGYFASDLMVDKVRDIIGQLQEIGDTVKADDIQGRLKIIKEDTLRQLRDKSELFAGGADTIKLGQYSFLVNTQPLDLTMVARNGDMYYHLTGTNFFERIDHQDFLALKPLWPQILPSENEEVYRAEYLAYLILKQSQNPPKDNGQPVPNLDKLHNMTEEELGNYVRTFMAPRYKEGYVKGVHDKDATLILKHLVELAIHADLLRFSSRARACGALWWQNFAKPEQKALLNHRLKGVGTILQVFPHTRQFLGLIEEVQKEVKAFAQETGLFNEKTAEEAGEYIFQEQSRGDFFVIDQESAQLYEAFRHLLAEKDRLKEFEKSIKALEGVPVAQYKLICKWLHAYVEGHTDKGHEYVEETAVLFLNNNFNPDLVRHVSLRQDIKGLAGQHTRIENGTYQLDFNPFLLRLQTFATERMAAYEKLQALKHELTTRYREELRLDEFKAKVMSSFVRNKLIDQVYLPLVGANLAKQMGTAGENKRTDRQGMLLIISPPGYGKTTLMEYLANRLGLVFIKVNGPAIGHHVTSLDPQDAPNAPAREELEKLNLAFEMGDNVMILLDDIQHLNPEFLQKFISLCDAQRKIEGTWRGRTRTYDLRGKKVAVVMAGNPYTESGDKFQIPDMLANRADIYNLGDVIGDSAETFKLSYLENSMASNHTLARLASKNPRDLYPLIRLTETGQREGLEFEGGHAAEELNEYVQVVKKLLAVRDIILKVNEAYIASAGQAEEYRTEPPFRLQGSYRDMNKIAEKVVPVMDERELRTLILSHYENESQTLTSGAEANFLKFKELVGWLSEEEKQRWEDIKALFQKGQRLKGYGENGQVAATLDNIYEVLKDVGQWMRER